MNKGKKKSLFCKRRGVLFLLISTLLMSACGNMGKSSSMSPEQEIVEETRETLPLVEISMPKYTLSYSGELKNVITVKETQAGNKIGLQFFVLLSQTEEPIFTLYYHSDQGELVTVLTDVKGNKIPVAFEMNTIPEGISEEDANLFYTAQDAVNEIVESLVLK